ncbi:flavodoxin [Anaeroselena agilis]|uniref:Flavodoxin n=1 Tax=Anaeroselena agilis TaxID=3063788 RepID=A0ABU3NSA7_9FIRM|nr:flavodoxin [Selenomonadales bacterium 4137-cl]
MAKRILVAVFSKSGNTRRIADHIHESVGGTIFEIQSEVPYPNDYNAIVEQAKKEIRAGHKPALKTKVDNIEAYDTVFVGSPNWWSTIAPPVATFLSEYDLLGKTVVPFCTHGGGGAGRIFTDIAALCPQATVLNGLEVYGDGGGNAKATISQWLHKIGVGKVI